MTRGGKRPGAGRRKGTVSAQTKAKRELAAKAESEGVTPLEVMLTTMRALWSEAVDQKTGKVVSLGKAMQANAVAKDAAPFIHPKLSSVQAEHTGKDGAELPGQQVTIFALPDNGRG